MASAERSRSVMQDDIGSAVEIWLHDKLGDILSHRVQRSHAIHWASNLRFLTFDDGGDEEYPNADDGALNSDYINASTPTESDSQERLVRELGTGHCRLCEIKGSQPIQLEAVIDGEKRVFEYSGGCVHVCQRTCVECRRIPLFPNGRQVKRFRIRRLQQASLRKCDHFVAVSYRWSDARKTAEQQPYQVVEEDGTVRDARAANEILDRIVAFARENGFRMIWIDQECIEQDKPQEKELAIQAMDYVYQNAHTSIGLLNVHLQPQHLYTLMIHYQMKSGKSVPVATGLSQARFGNLTAICVERKIIREAVTLVVGDSWNTRAWILQEAFASSGNMLLLFPRQQLYNVVLNGWHLISQDASESELAIKLDKMQVCLQACVEAPKILDRDEWRRDWDRMETETRETLTRDGSWLNPQNLPRIKELIDWFHPPQPNRASQKFVETEESLIQRTYKAETRRTCSAAMALPYLRLRNLHEPADKLAILGNMCDYDFRLNTSVLAHTQESLYTCVIALSLANGDFSLLVPQLYESPLHPTMNPSQRTNDFSWMGSFIRQNTCVAQDTEWDPQGRTAATKAAEFGGLLEEGLCFSVLLWRVSEFIDLKEIQEKYRQPWTSLRSLKGRFRPNYGTLESATTFILHEVITYLRTHEEEDLANAILNSTSDWRWRGPDSSLGSAQVRRAGQFSTSPIYQEDLNDYWKSDIIESVAQVPLGLDADASRNMFLLDASTDRCPLQSWFVDRIMDKGGFWSGHPIRQTTNPWGFDSPHETDMVLLQIDPASNASGKAQVRNIYRPPDSPDAYMTHSAGAPPVSHGEALIQASRITKHSNRHLQCHTHCPDFDLREGDTGLRTRNTVQSVLMLTGLAEGKRLGDMTDRHKRRAIFDIDGDINGKIMVLSPLQMVLEAVPRSRLRGMSVSWVVEPAERDGESKIEDTYKFEAKGQVQGMWPFSIIPSGRYNLV